MSDTRDLTHDEALAALREGAPYALVAPGTEPQVRFADTGARRLPGTRD